MTEVFPDIEIYIKNPEPESLLEWLSVHFDIVATQQKSKATHYQLVHDGSELKAILMPEAVKGKFASLWFTSNNTPWGSDMECARDAFQQLDKEVRCSLGSWEPCDSEDELWLRINEAGEKKIRWNT